MPRHTTCLGSRVSLSAGVSSISSPSPPPHGHTHVAFTWLHALVITDGVDIAYLAQQMLSLLQLCLSIALSLWHECRKTQNRHNVVDIVFSLSSFLCLLPARKITRHILLEVFEHPEPPGAGQEAVAVMLEGGAGGQGVVDPPQPRGHEVGEQHVDTAGTNQR